LRDHLNAALADRYSIERELGRGGMATVWLARDLRHDRFVALKVLDAELSGAIGVERFLREIRLTARLQHPNIVPVLDSGVCPGPDGQPLPWFTMTFVDGESLRHRLTRERQLPIEDAMRIAEAAAAALACAHASGIVHRDIKPENLLLSGEHTFVADFGIAKAVLDTGTDRLTYTGVVVGTPAYMSPEQATNDVVDERSDQYALATVAYEMLAGEPPFTGPTAQAVLARRLAEPARSIRTVRSTVSPAIEAAVLRALERVPADRFAKISDFGAALRSLTTGEANLKRSRLGRRAVVVVLLIAAAIASSFVARRLRGAHHARSVDAEMLYRRGMQSYAKRTPAGATEALAAFSAAIRLDSSYGDAWAGLAKTYVRAYERRFVFVGAGRDTALRLAVAAADRALAADQRSADAWLTKGMVDRQVDPTNDAPALRSFQQAVKIDSTLAKAWQQLGGVHLGLGQFDAAMVAWRRAVAADPKYTEGLAFMALGHYWRRQYDSAQHWADSAIVIDPSFLLGRQAQGYVAVEQGDFARATAAFSAAERISTDVEVIHSLAGQALALARAGRRREALALLDRAESLATPFSPTDLHTAVYMAQPYSALGDPGHAIAWLERFKPSADLHFQAHMQCDPPFDPIAHDRRFQSLLLMPRPPTPRGC
jgi:tetratricopeptide (TPR) repeat protein/tRNA A-37 threonylcarbamoyl transferase component Bud32